MDVYCTYLPGHVQFCVSELLFLQFPLLKQEKWGWQNDTTATPQLQEWEVDCHPCSPASAPLLKVILFEECNKDSDVGMKIIITILKIAEEERDSTTD